MEKVSKKQANRTALWCFILPVSAGLLFLLLFVLTCSSSAEKQYYSVSEVIEQANALLNENGKLELEIQGETFVVSVDIPPVVAVPVLTVSLPSLEQMPSDAEADFINGQLSSCLVIKEKEQDSLYGAWIKNSTRIITDDPNAYADESPFTFADSVNYSEQLLHPYTTSNDWDFRITRTEAHSRLYRTSFGKAGIEADLSQPLSQSGFYRITFQQFFHDIPYWSGHYFSVPSRFARKSPTPGGNAIVDIFSSENYSYYFSPAVETGMIGNDIPLCSFETILHSFQRSERYSIIPAVLKLVYIPWNDPLDKEGNLILLPAWILEGTDRGTASVLADCISAQTGELIDHRAEDENGTRDDAIWFSWKSIEQ